TSQLDPLGAADVLERYRQVADTHGFSIVLVEDKVDELVRVADRIVLLDRGRISLDAAPREFCLSAEPLARAGVRSTQVAELSAAPMAGGCAVCGRRPDHRRRRCPGTAQAAGMSLIDSGSLAVRVEDVQLEYPPPRRIRALGGISVNL